MGKYA